MTITKIFCTIIYPRFVHNWKAVLVVILIASFQFSCDNRTHEKIDLAGEWQVRLDSLDIGEKEKWFESDIDGAPITLSGTLDEHGFGNKSSYPAKMNDTTLFSLSRKAQYVGKAWYQKTIEIPKDWENKTYILHLERAIWQSQVYVNGNLVGKQKSLSTPHHYKIDGLLKSGENTITIQVDNSYIHKGISFEHERYPTPESQGFSHAYTNQTQGKWNGIIGKMSLELLDNYSIVNVFVKPSANQNKLFAEIEMVNPPSETIVFEYAISGNEKKLINDSVQPSKISGNMVSVEIDLPETIKKWDEFNPNLYELNLALKGTNKNHTTFFGVRDISTKDAQLILNGERLFLRGNLDCAVFPIKGRPYMTETDWKATLKIVKSYGFNHIRFHSWCPPEAAFSVADQLGLYLQIELPHWSLNVGEDIDTNAFLEKEMRDILDTYGNHPSFMFLSMGNELEGDFSFLNDMVEKAKTIDPNRLYTTSTFSFQKGIGTMPQPSDDYLITQWTDKGWVRGQGYFNDISPRFDADFRERMNHLNVPMVSHEIGQYAVYPNLLEIEKYTGIVEPLNFIAIKNDLKKKGLLHLAPKFTQASGKLAAILYKEDIERALKTPDFDGFQMLQLQDYPGHGSATVGLLDVFWESKGIIDSTEFKTFNSPIVPLLRFEKAIYRSGENFMATIEVANFKSDSANQTISWKISDEDHILNEGKFENLTIRRGVLDTLGQINTTLSVEAPKQLKVTLQIENSDYKNAWDIWVYPEFEDIRNSKVIQTRSTREAIKLLNAGNTVLLNPNLEKINGFKNRFGPIFWSQLMFEQPPNMGILCDPEHEAFNYFPTENHSNWEWWDLTTNSKILHLDFLEEDPIVRIIDDFTTNRNLGIMFEAKVGEGRLLFTSIDLNNNLDERPAARQLKYSIERYMNSETFQPRTEIGRKDLLALIKN